MPAEAKSKTVNSYIGMDDAVKIFDLIKQGLLEAGFSDESASRYAWFCQAIYKEVKDQHDVLDGLNKIAGANRLLPQAVSMNLVKSSAAIKDFRLSASVAVVSPFIDRVAAIAKLYGIELNECSLAVTKVALDIAGAGTGAVTSVEGIGIPLLVLSVIATFNDSYALSNACFRSSSSE